MSTATEARAEWLAWRRTGIGASDIAALLGLSPWASPFSVWVDKLGLLPDEDLDDDDPREFGRRAEAMVGPWFRDRTGLELAGEQLWLTHPEQPWLKATPDAVVVEGGGDTFYDWSGDFPALGPLEIKTDMGRPWPTIPEHYQAQGQQQMLVGGWDRMWFAVLHGRRFRVYELERDAADCDLIETTAREFWHEHVLAKVPPPVDGSDATAAALKALYPVAEAGKTVEFSDAQAAQLRYLANAKQDEAAATERVKNWTNRVRQMLGDAEIGTFNGKQIVTLRSQTRETTCKHCGAVDESAPFRVLRPSKEFT